MAVGCSRVTVVVVLKVDWACAVAVMVTTLFVGTVAGAVYNPLVILIDPVPVPLTDQFTSVLLRPITLAVHWEVARTVTSVGVHEAVMVGAVVVLELLPQELKIAGTAISAQKKSRCSQRTWPRPKRKFGSNTRSPPARATQLSLNLKKIQSQSFQRAPLVSLGNKPCPHPFEGAPGDGPEPKESSHLTSVDAPHLPVNIRPLRTRLPPAPNPHIRTPATYLVASS
jgi:hypothetical protein